MKIESSRIDPVQVAELRKLVSQGEGLQLEFKRKAAFPDKIVREMIALANTQGGVLLLGVNDDGELSGLKHPEDDVHEVERSLQRCLPPLKYEKNYIHLPNSRVVVQYKIPISLVKPHRFLLPTGTTETYVRVADRSIRASREVKEILRRNRIPRNIGFHYGLPEDRLIKYLDEHQEITLQEFRTIAGLRRQQASGTLIRLVLADVLKVTPDERGDRYSRTGISN